MNDTLRTIGRRYSCRSFSGAMPPDNQLEAISLAALAAPSGMNRQAWRIILIKDRALIRDLEVEGVHVLSEMADKGPYSKVRERGGTLFYGAPCMIVVAIEPVVGAALDCGIVCQNIALAATSLGLGCLICGMAGLAFTGSCAADFKQRLRFPRNYEFGGAVLLGYSTAPKAPHDLDHKKIIIID